jgi:hypothetical protein
MAVCRRFADHRFAEGGAVDRGAGADLDVVFDASATERTRRGRSSDRAPSPAPYSTTSLQTIRLRRGDCCHMSTASRVSRDLRSRRDSGTRIRTPRVK